MDALERIRKVAGGTSSSDKAERMRRMEEVLCELSSFKLNGESVLIPHLTEIAAIYSEAERQGDK